MQFESIHAALQMDGHGAHVWFVYLAAMVLTAGLILLPLWRARQIVQQQRGMLKRIVSLSVDSEYSTEFQAEFQKRGGDDAPTA